MDFKFSEEQALIQASLREFVESEILPQYSRWDKVSKADSSIESHKIVYWR
jgi:alkylation response protein AidB-like acyl-CoA dehydrogenase